MVKSLQIFLFFFLIPFNLLAQEEDILSDSLERDTLLIGYNISPPFVDETNGDLHGPAIWLWEQITEEHDLQYTMVQMSLDSLLEALSAGTIDMSASPLTITSDRMKQMDFSPPYYIAHSSILTKKAESSGWWWEFVKSFFSGDFLKVLGAMFVVILIFGFLVWLFERKKNTGEFEQGIKGVWNGFWWSAVTMTTVGYGDKSPQTFGGRMIALIWMFTAIIIVSGFTASIASALTVNQIGSQKNSIEDFKENKLGTIEKSGTQKWLTDNFYSNKIAYDKMEKLTDALDTDQIDAVAYDRPILQNIIKTDSLATYQILDIEYNPQFYAMGMSWNVPDELKQMISVSILKLTEGMDWKVLLSECDLE